MKAIGVLGVLMLLAACAPPQPPLGGGAPPGIAYRVEGESLADYNRRAEHYCQQFGKHARRTSVKQNGDASIAEYACS